MRMQGFIRRARVHRTLAAAALVSAALVACEEDQGPGPAPTRLTVVSGDNQYSRKGTELQAPIVFRVTLSDGNAGKGEVIKFQVVEGGGSLSRSSASAGTDGRVSVNWTMGPATGPQRMRATAASNPSLAVQVVATSADFYCPEENPAFVRRFSPAQDLFLFTKQSELLKSGGQRRAGLVQISPAFPVDFGAASYIGFDEGSLLNIVHDAAFSAGGDFYVSWITGAANREILKISNDRTSSHFASLESYLGSEIATLPGGVLAGCDEFGPFTVGCRDTLTRYEDALFSGEARDAANHDAMAVDPVSGDLYFIYLGDRTLRRLPLDGYTQTGAIVEVVTLALDEADGARGMAVDDNDGSVFILVESANTKGIVKVTPGGTRSTVVDFFVERGAGNLAGIQSDLAIDQTFRQLYTLDTLNNVIVFYQIATGNLGTLTSAGDPGAASDGSFDERVGLAVMP